MLSKLENFEQKPEFLKSLDRPALIERTVSTWQKEFGLMPGETGTDFSPQQICIKEVKSVQVQNKITRVSGDEEVLVMASGSRLLVFDSRVGQVQMVEAHQQDITALSRQGQTVVTMSTDRTVGLWGVR